MTSLDPKTREQLCAWMDGELPTEEALFLERRLAHDVELRSQWERWQMASACIRGQSPLPMRGDFSERVLAAVSLPAEPASKRSPFWGWAIAASVAALAVTVGLQMRPDKSASAVVATHSSPMSTAPMTASPASADLVAASMAIAPSPEPVAAEVAVRVAPGVRTSAASRTTAAVALQSPMPLGAQSPTQFPLSQTSEAKSWPRSPLAIGNDTSMEAYLVRHNEMVSDGGLGGFVPYVDVVTRERDGAETQAGGDDGR